MQASGPDRVSEVAAAMESSIESLLAVLDRARLAQSGTVPPTQLRVLTVVQRNRHTNMSRLAEALEVVPSSASRLCDRLEATGLLRRIPDPRDRREVRLELTPSARPLMDELRERPPRAVARVLAREPPSSRAETRPAPRALPPARPPPRP